MNRLTKFRDAHPVWFIVLNLLFGVVVMALLVLFEYFVLEFSEPPGLEDDALRYSEEFNNPQPPH